MLHIPGEIETDHQDNEQDASLNKIPKSWDFEFYAQNMDKACFQRWILPGKICAAVISITEDLILHLCPEHDETLSSSHLSIPKMHLERSSRFCFYLLNKTLIDNQFFWGDITVCFL